MHTTNLQVHLKMKTVTLLMMNNSLQLNYTKMCPLWLKLKPTTHNLLAMTPFNRLCNVPFYPMDYIYIAKLETQKPFKFYEVI
jgi:hypothetical protein